MAGWFEEAPIRDSEYEMDSRLMWDRARVRAPAIMVEVLEEMDSGVVVESRAVRLRRSSSSTRRKGRYLLPVGVDVDGGGGFTFSLRPGVLVLVGSVSFRRLVESVRSCWPGAWGVERLDLSEFEAERGRFCSVGLG